MNVEAVDDAAKEAVLVLALLVLSVFRVQIDELRAEKRHERHGEEIRSEDADYNAERQVSEEIATDTVEQEDV